MRIWWEWWAHYSSFYDEHGKEKKIDEDEKGFYCVFMYFKHRWAQTNSNNSSSDYSIDNNDKSQFVISTTKQHSNLNKDNIVFRQAFCCGNSSSNPSAPCASASIHHLQNHTLTIQYTWQIGQNQQQFTDGLGNLINELELFLLLFKNIPCNRPSGSYQREWHNATRPPTKSFPSMIPYIVLKVYILNQ